MPALLKKYNSFRKSYRVSFEDLLSLKVSSSSTWLTFSLNSFKGLFDYTYIFYSPYESYSSSFSLNYIFPSCSIIPFSLIVASCFYEFAFSICKTFLCLKAALRVLFFLMKHILRRPSHSRKSISGKGFLGYILTMLLSTLGGGLKLFLPTFIR